MLLTAVRNRLGCRSTLVYPLGREWRRQSLVLSIWRWTIVVGVLGLVTLTMTFAATKTAGNGNWNTAGTWSPSGVPGAGDSVYIPSGANITLDVNGTCGALNMAGNFTIPATVNRTLTITTSSGLSGNFYSSGNINGFGSASGQIITIGGILSVTAGNFSPGTGSTLRFNGTGSKTFSNTNNVQTLEVNGSGLTLTLLTNASIQANLTITTGTLDLASYTANRASSGGTITVGAGATLRIGGTNTFPSNYTTRTLNATSTIEYYGTAQTISNQSYGHLTLSGTGTKTMPGSAMTIAGNFTTSGTVSATAGAALTFNGDVTIGNGTTFGGGSYTHNLKGDWTKAGTFNASTGIILCNGTTAQIINASNFNLLRVQGASANVTLAGNITCASDFDFVSGAFSAGSYSITITGTGGGVYTGDGFSPGTGTIIFSGSSQVLNSTVAVNNVTLTGTASLTPEVAITLNGNLTIGNGCTFNAATFSHAIKGDFVNNGTFTASTSTFTFNGTSGQNITGSTVSTFKNLALNNSSGLTLGVNATVGGTLTFTSGNITTGSNSLIINSTGSVSRTSGHVVGNFQKYITTGATSKTFEIGTGSNYTPVAVTFGNVSVAGNLTASTASGDHASIGSSSINSAKSVNRTWTMTNSGITFTNYSATFTFVAGDIDGGASTSNFIVGKYSPTTWTYPTVGTKTATTTQITGVTSFSDFQIGETGGGGSSSITVDATSSGTAISTNTKTVSHTTGSGSSRLMLVGVSLFDGGAGRQVSSVTYSGQSLTFVGGRTDNSNSVRIEIWRLINPPSGVANVVVTLNGSSDGIVVGVTTFSGADQTTPLGSFASAQGMSAAPSVSVTSASDELVFDVMAMKDGTAVTVGSGQTQRWSAADANNKIRGSASTEGGASSVTMSWAENGGNSKEWAIGAVSIKVAGATYSISGNVFEDVNYGGGAGRTKAASSGVGRQYADVELYNSSGVYVSGTNTDANGDYSFTGVTAGTYYVRVVTDSVRSSRTGWTTSCKPVMTFRTNAASGSAVAVTDYVGGTNPSATDPGIGSSGATFNTTTFVYTAVLTGTAQAVTQCVVTSANITGVDFGFNYNTIANTNDAGQGSMRQGLANMNTLTGDASLAQSGLVAAKDNAVFMISNGTAAAGLRSANNYFSGGAATISPTSAFPTISTVMIVDGQKQPGWTSAPVIELNGSLAGGSPGALGVSGIRVSAGSSTIRGFVINQFTGAGVRLETSGSNTIASNYIGTDVTGSIDRGNSWYGIYVVSVGSNVIGGSSAPNRNVISGNDDDGIALGLSGASNNIIQNNYIGTSASGSGSLGNSGDGINLIGSGANPVNNNQILDNTIANNGGRGFVMTDGTGNAILRTNMYNNSNIGIDLGSNGVTANNGTKNASLPNYEMDSPVFTSAVLNGTTLTFAGYVGSAPSQSTFANAIVDIFKSDNDGSGNGEGQTYLGQDTCDANGNFSGSFTVAGVSAGDKITGTATDGSNNTSEFGANYTVTTTYYSKGSLAVSTAANWNTARDGSGTNATSFVPGCSWVVQNTHAMTLSGSTTWDVSVTGTVQIESGGSWTNSSSGVVTIGTLQVDNGGSYAHGTSNALPGSSKSFGATSTVSYYGATQTVEALTYGHLTIASAGTRTLGGNATVAGDLTISGGTFDLSSYTANRSSAGGTLTVSNGATLKIGGAGTIPSNYSTHTIGATSTIEYSGTDQSIASLNSSQSYGHLTLSGSGTKTPAAGLTVAGNLTINAGPTFSAGSYTHTVQGNWSNSGTFTLGTSTIQFTGSSDVSLTGATTFNVVVVNKSSSTNTVTLNNNVATATLTMTQGKISTGSNSILVTSSRTGNGLVIGTITRTHTFSASTAYAFEGPDQTLTFANGGTLPTSVTVTTTLSSPGANDYMDPITRYYDISQSGGSGFTYALRLHYEDSEVSAPNSETSPPLKIWRRTSTGLDVWTREGATSNSTTDNWVEQTGLTNTGTFSLSSRTIANMVLTLNQSATNPSPGDQVTYTVNYSNDGDGSSTSTLVTAAAPANTSYVAGSTQVNSVSKTDAADADEVTVSGSTISVNLGTISVGSSGTITYSVVVN